MRPFGGPEPDARDDAPLSRRSYLILAALDAGMAWPQAVCATLEAFCQHPEWDMSEVGTWASWEADTWEPR